MDRPERSEGPPTRNKDAYIYFLKGLEYRSGDLRIATQMFEKAVELDANFAKAWAYLSASYSKMFYAGFDGAEKRKALAVQAFQTAEGIEPGLPETLWAKGVFYYYGEHDFEKSEKYFILAGQIWKGSPEISLHLGYVYRSQEKYDLAIKNFEVTSKLSPLESKPAWDVGQCYFLLRQFKKAERWFTRAKSIEPDAARPLQSLHKLYVSRGGEIKKARENLEEYRLSVDSKIGFHNVDFYVLYREHLLRLLERRYIEALNLLDEFPRDVYGSGYHRFPVNLLRAQVLRLMGNLAESKALFDAAKEMLQKDIVEAPSDYRNFAALGIACTGLGLQHEAIENCNKAIEIQLKTEGRRYARIRLEDLAEIYTLLGETENAIDLLEELLSAPGELSISWLSWIRSGIRCAITRASRSWSREAM